MPLKQLPPALLALSATVCLACGKQPPPTVTPALADIPTSGNEPEPEPEPEPVRRVGDRSIAVGTFNLQWAHDATNGDGPKLAERMRAQTSEDWDWKVEQIARLLVQEKLDVIALQELGGSSELIDIVMKVEELSGIHYDWAFVDSEDRVAGHHVGIMSRWTMTDERRFDIHMRRHVVADVELPDGTVATFVALHAAGGKYGKDEQARTKQAKALKRKIAKLQQTRPVVVLGTTNSPVLPDERKYRSTSVGALAGAATKQAVDDCNDSAGFLTGQNTTVHGDNADRILSCGLTVEDVETIGHDLIIRDEADPDDVVWSEVPLEEAPYRDVSDHLILWAELALPEPPGQQGDDESESSGASTASP